MRRLHFSPCLLALALVANVANATERNQLRSLPGLPGFDLTAPLLPGLYFQSNYQHYSADRVNSNDGNPAISPTPQPGILVRADAKVRADVLALRGTWLSESNWGDGKLGLSVTVPLVRTEVTVTPTILGGQAVPAIIAAVNAQAAVASGRQNGLGDVEIAPFVDFQTDESRTTVALAVVAPTGQYESMRQINTGAGKFWTIRPIVTLAKVYENGIEIGARTSYSINGKNSDTQYTSGQYLQSDFSALYGIKEGVKAGLAGYFIYQTTDDKGTGAPSHGNRAKVFGIGPAVSWQSESGSTALESKLLKEYGAKNRPEGTTFWARLFLRLD